MQVKNETDNIFQIKLWLDKTHLNGELLSMLKIDKEYKIEERNHLIKQQFWGGYSRHNQIIKIEKSEEVTTEKLLVENHAVMMYEPFLEEKK